MPWSAVITAKMDKTGVYTGTAIEAGANEADGAQQKGCAIGPANDARMLLEGNGNQKETRNNVAESIQTWFADDLRAAGTAEYNAEVMAYMAENGPRRGYFLQCDKLWYVCKGEDEAVACRAFEERGLESALLVGTIIWEIGWETRQGRRPGWRTRSSAYAGFVFCLQMVWGYVSRVSQHIAHHSAPLEMVIRQRFLPALLDVLVGFIGTELSKFLGHSIKTGGIGVCNPVSTAGAAFEVSRD
ncbi:hypothetical protein ACHAWF_007199, partial [Thalassiosira exigua]